MQFEVDLLRLGKLGFGRERYLQRALLVSQGVEWHCARLQRTGRGSQVYLWHLGLFEEQFWREVLVGVLVRVGFDDRFEFDLVFFEVEDF
jgi:hypothetical protein